MEADLRLDDDGHSIMRAFRAFVASPQGCACMGVVPYDGIRLIAVAMSHDASLLLLSHPGSERAFHFLFVSVCEVPDEARRVARLLPRWTINHILHENVLLLARMTDALSADDTRIHAAHLLFNRHDHDSKVALLVQHGDRAAFHAEQQYSLVAGLLHTELAMRAGMQARAAYDASNVARAIEDGLGAQPGAAPYLQALVGSFVSSMIDNASPVVARRGEAHSSSSSSSSSA